MTISLNQPFATQSDIVIADASATIVINANLTSTAGKIYILGKNVIINGDLYSNYGINVVGFGETIVQAMTVGMFYSMDLETFPKSFLNGRHISANIAEKLKLN